MIPAAGFAAEAADEASTDADIELQSVDAVDAINANGYISQATNWKGSTIENLTANSVVSYTENGKPQGIVPKAITYGPSVNPSTLSNLKDFTVQYYQVDASVSTIIPGSGSGAVGVSTPANQPATVTATPGIADTALEGNAASGYTYSSELSATSTDNTITLSTPTVAGADYSWTVSGAGATIKSGATSNTVVLNLAAGDCTVTLTVSDSSSNPIFNQKIVIKNTANGTPASAATPSAPTDTPDVLAQTNAVKGTLIGATPASAAGSYYAVAVGSGDYAGAYVAKAYTIKAAEENVTLGIANKETGGSSFMYTGKDWDAFEAIILPTIDDQVTTKWQLKIVSTAVNSTVVATVGTTNAAVPAPGNYIATFERVSDASITQNVPFTIDKLDLSKVAFAYPDCAFDGSTPTNNLFGGTAADADADGDKTNESWALNTLTAASPAVSMVPALDAAVQSEIVVTQTSGNYNKVGSLGFKVAVSDAATALTNTNTVSAAGGFATGTLVYNVVDKVLSATDFTYDDSPWQSTMSVNLAKGESFDNSLIEVSNTENGVLPAAEYTVKAVNKATGEVVTGDLSKLGVGVYDVTVEVNADKTQFAYGGKSNVLALTVTAGSITADSCYVYLDNVMFSSKNVEYNGKDWLPQISTVVMNKRTQLTEGTDYTVVITNSDGDEVDEIVNAGTYTIGFESSTYTFPQGSEATLTVNPADLTDAKITNAIVQNNGVYYFGWTGEAVEPAYQFDMPLEGSNKANWIDIASDDIDVTIQNKNGATVNEMVDENTYTVNVAVTGNNYVANTFTLTVEVTKNAIGFIDVPSDSWFAPYVFKAAQNYYMTGYEGTNFFGPNDSLTRGQAAVVFYRMGLGSKVITDDPTKSDVITTITRFSDCEFGMYYNPAVDWADKVGVVTGYAGTDLFGPNETANREAFVTMLARYAKAVNKYTAPENVDAVLAEYIDGANVSPWARESVAWALEQGIISGYGDTKVLGPQNSVTRAQAAKMAVEFQPKMLNASIVPVN